MVLVGLGLIVGVAEGYRTWLQHRMAGRLAIRTPHGIQESRFVAINGVEQWITIRGQDRANPVLLIDAGGHGGTSNLLAPLFLPYERDFTLVHWDRQGAGKTFARAGGRIDPALTQDGLAADGIAVAQYLRRRLGKERIALLGVSFGSISALKMIKARPELFSVYVGTGQEIDQPAEPRRAYDRAMSWAQDARDQTTVSGLTALGPPPYAASETEAFEALEAVVRPSEGRTAADDRDLALAIPGWSIAELLAAQRAGKATRHHFTEVSKEHGRFQATSLGVGYRTPIVLIHGEWDDPELSAQWLASVWAPHKAAIVLPKAGHSALIVEPRAFGEVMRRDVLPLARVGDTRKPPPGGATALR